MKEQYRRIARGLYPPKSFPRDVLSPGGREAAAFPTRRVCPAHWTLCFPQEESPTSTAHLFFLVEVLIKQVPVLSVQQDLCCRWAIIHILLQPTFHIQSLITAVYKHVGRQGGQRRSLPAVPSKDLPLFTLFVEVTAFCMAGD